MRSKTRSPLNRRQFLARAAAGAAAVGITFKLPNGAFADGGKVNFYNWDTYIGENTIEQFEDSSGIEVQYDLFADNDELFAKLRGGNPGYDVIVPTNDYIERMIVADMLMPLDHSKIPNKANIDANFLDPAFDPARQFSLPYMWGTIGIGYRKSAVEAAPTSWNEILTSDKYAGRIALMSEAQTVLQVALKAMGKSLNDWTDENIAAAEAMITAQKSNITAFAPDNGQDLLLAGEVDFAMEWNGDILQVMEEDDDIGFVVPDEGGLLWEDALCIPKGAPNYSNLSFDRGTNVQDIRGKSVVFLAFSAPTLIWLVLFFIVPLGIIWLYSFGENVSITQIETTWTLDNYRRILQPEILQLIGRSFWLAGVATVICLLIGFPMALVIATASYKAKPWLLLLIMLPFWTNLLIRTYALLNILGTRGRLNDVLGWLYERAEQFLALIGLGGLELLGSGFKPLTMLGTPAGVIYGIVYVSLPFTILPIYSALERMDKSLLEASMDLGAGQLQTARNVLHSIGTTLV